MPNNANSIDFQDSESSRFDWSLVFIIISLVSVGLLNIWSAGDAGEANVFTKQLLWAGLGAGLIGGMMLLDYRLVERVAYIGYGLNLLALVAVEFVGVVRYGARRWIDLGFMQYQPSESMKLMVILALAKFFHNQGERRGAMGLSDMWKPLLMLVVPGLLTIIQPDLGTGGHLMMIGTAIILFVGVKKRILLTVFIMGLVSAPVAWKSGLKPYQRDRVMTFIDPTRDPKGKGFNAIQAMTAVGSGQVFGKGLRHGTQTQLDFTPEEHTDFIFTVLAEEWGFVGCMFLFALYLMLFQRLIHISSMARDRFGALVGVGIVAMMLTQVVINVSMVTGMFPIVGIPLPLVSYGGTSMLTMSFAMALVLNIGYRRTMF